VQSPRYRAATTGLRDELVNGIVVASPDVPKRMVTMRSRVRVRDLEADESQTYTLVYPEEADIDQGKLSILAPLATALLGARTGQVVKFDAPAGPRRLLVEKILYQPEAAGDFHL
jgi:regulator of nucleoside diphosphate kinase